MERTRRARQDTERGKACERTRQPLGAMQTHCHGNDWRESADKEEGIKREGRDHCFTLCVCLGLGWGAAGGGGGGTNEFV